MSLNKLANETNPSGMEVDPGYIDDVAMESMQIAILTEHLSKDEMKQYIEEGAKLGIVTEKNIVRLDKKAKMEQAYKVAVLQCAAEANNPKYKKLRTLWKMEAKLFKELERMYRSKAQARAKEAVRNLKANGKPRISKVVANRAAKNLGGTGNFSQVGPK